MKNLTLFIFLFVFTAFVVPAQPKSGTVAYKTENNIPYRSGENLDDYQKERCKLDIYFPENVDSFTTVVWFHGGG
ncbi:MAG: alpha/beta hydrolase, partial [Bacteroidota bacterium]|nr:alpha/beta hydrolase [Bacteroidota bacterium]